MTGSNASIDIWQEIECPIQGADFDVDGDEMVYTGKVFDCPWCWGKHVASEDIVTTYMRDANKESCLPLLKTLESLNRMRAR